MPIFAAAISKIIAARAVREDAAENRWSCLSPSMLMEATGALPTYPKPLYLRAEVQRSVSVDIDAFQRVAHG